MRDNSSNFDHTIPPTLERALEACQRVADCRPREIHSAVIHEAGQLLLDWQLAALRHDVTWYELSFVASLPSVAMDAILLRVGRTKA